MYLSGVQFLQRLKFVGFLAQYFHEEKRPIEVSMIQFRIQLAYTNGVT